MSAASGGFFLHFLAGSLLLETLRSRFALLCFALLAEEGAEEEEAPRSTDVFSFDLVLLLVSSGKFE